MLYRYGLAFVDVTPELKESIKGFATEKGTLSQL
jgi:hypothetical protein